MGRIDFNGEYVKTHSFAYQSYGDKTDKLKVIVESESCVFGYGHCYTVMVFVGQQSDNAYKYAFPVPLKEDKNKIVPRDNKSNHMKISDNGIGLPEGFQLNKTESLGMPLIQTLTNIRLMVSWKFKGTEQLYGFICFI